MKCNSERCRGVEEELRRGPKPQALSRPMVELIHGMRNLRVGHRRQIPVFRKVLANKAVGIFVQAAFPRGIRMREVDLGCKVTRHPCMVGELASIVISVPQIIGEPAADL